MLITRTTAIITMTNNGMMRFVKSVSFRILSPSPAAVSELLPAIPQQPELPDEPGRRVSSRYAEDTRHHFVGRPMVILIVSSGEVYS
jgi:hypothetical protein